VADLDAAAKLEDAPVVGRRIARNDVANIGDEVRLG
jgi:hypothetical protein